MSNHPPLTPAQNETLRLVVRGILALRHPAALNLLQIRNRAAQEIDFPIVVEHIHAAATFLVSLGHVTALAGELGVTTHYQATAPGILAHERCTSAGA